MPVIAASSAAASRNARKKRKDQEREAARNAERILRERKQSKRQLNIEGQEVKIHPQEKSLHRQNSANSDGRDSSERFYSFRDKARSIPFAYQMTGNVAIQAKGIVQSQGFNLFIIAVILVASVLVGLQTYPSMETNVTVNMIDTIVLGIFCFEVIIKMIAEGLKPWRYFTNHDWKWNCFDFFIVFMSLPIWDWGSSVAILRLMRLLRVVKLIKKVPQLYMIVMGLVGGLKAIVYIMLLLMIIFYLYAILGIFAFGENDRFHFGDLWSAMLTLWRIATFEDWTDIFYTNFYGCASELYDSGFYTVIEEEANGKGFYFCDMAKDSSAQGWLSVIYFISFVFISALVMLSLFVGAVTMSMTESMEALKQEEETKEREKIILQARMTMSGSASGAAGVQTDSSTGSRPQGIREKISAILGKIPLLKRCVPSSLNGDRSKADEEENDTELNANELHRLKGLLEEIIRGEDGDVDDDDDEDDFKDYHPLKRWWAIISTRADEIAESSWFSNFITFVIIVAAVLVGWSTFDLSQDEKDLAAVLDLVILIIFCLEVVIKTIGAGFQPWNYFYLRKVQRWNTFDFIVVAGSLLPGSGSLLTILRLLRLLRVLKLLKALPELQMIVSALLDAFGSITYIFVILVLAFYVFAIVGMILFQENDPWHFESLHITMYTLFRCATLEDWTEVMYINMFGCDMFGYSGMEELCVKPVAWYSLASIYFTLFTMIGGLVLMTLFIGVVTTSMEQASQNQREQKEIEERLMIAAERHSLSAKMVVKYRDIFAKIDLDGGGTIDEEELAIGFIAAGQRFTKDEIKDLVAQVDDDNSGELDLAEFADFMQVYINEYRARQTEALNNEVQVLEALERAASREDLDEGATETDSDSRRKGSYMPRGSIAPFLNKKKNVGKVTPVEHEAFEEIANKPTDVEQNEVIENAKTEAHIEECKEEELDNVNDHTRSINDVKVPDNTKQCVETSKAPGEKQGLVFDEENRKVDEKPIQPSGINLAELAENRPLVKRSSVAEMKGRPKGPPPSAAKRLSQGKPKPKVVKKQGEVEEDEDSGEDLI